MRNGVISFHVDFKSSEIQKKNNTLITPVYQYIELPSDAETKHSMGKFLLLSRDCENLMCTLRPFMIGCHFGTPNAGFQTPEIKVVLTSPSKLNIKYYLTQGFNHFTLTDLP